MNDKPDVLSEQASSDHESRDKLDRMWTMQRIFSEKLYDAGHMPTDLREAKTRELALALHHEVSKLVSCVNFRGHHPVKAPVDRSRIIYEAVDAVRYCMAICNLWDFDVNDFIEAWDDKDYYINRMLIQQSEVWDGRPVLIWDIDDVIADFRRGFATWITSVKGIDVDPNSHEYFFIEQLEDTGQNSLDLYREFIDERGIVRLPAIDAVDVVNKLYDEGAWIHIVTARPRNNLTCRYDTYHWLRDVGVKFNALDFTGEKLPFVVQSRYCADKRVAACIDDSPAHVRSYVSHGFKCFMPVKAYNHCVQPASGLERYTSADQLYESLASIVRSMM